jgi:hypothetical protein
MEERTTLVAKTALQRLMMEQALAMAEELERAGDAAADGRVLDVLESLAVDRGREFTRSALEGALQHQVEDFEKKFHEAVVADVVKSATTKASRRAKS